MKRKEKYILREFALVAQKWNPSTLEPLNDFRGICTYKVSYLSLPGLNLIIVIPNLHFKKIEGCEASSGSQQAKSEEGGNPLGSKGLQQEAKESFPKKKMPASNFHQT